jgi:hypothetical protein
MLKTLHECSFGVVFILLFLLLAQHVTKRKRGFRSGNGAAARCAAARCDALFLRDMTPNPRRALLLAEVRSRDSASVERACPQHT